MKASVFKEDYIAIIARELLKGLEYLHGEGKLHRGNISFIYNDIHLVIMIIIIACLD